MVTPAMRTTAVLLVFLNFTLDKFKIIITLRRALKFEDTGPYKNFEFLFNRLMSAIFLRNVFLLYICSQMGTPAGFGTLIQNFDTLRPDVLECPRVPRACCIYLYAVPLLLSLPDARVLLAESAHSLH